MPRNKDLSKKVKITISQHEKKSITFSFRVLDKKVPVVQIETFLKDNLWKI